MMTSTSKLALVASMLCCAYAADSPLAGIVVTPLSRTKNFNHYLAEASIGTPPQKSYLVVDTGSATTSFQWAHNPICAQENRPCDEHGVYDNATSSTATIALDSFNDGLSDHGRGTEVSDLVSLGSTDLGRITVGVVDHYEGQAYSIPIPIERIMGLALNCNAALGANGDCSEGGPYILTAMRNASVINRRAVSFYLGPDSPNTTNAKMIVGDGYDRAKQGGKPFIVPMTDPTSGLLSLGQTNSVNVTAIVGRFANGTTARYDFPTKEGRSTLQDTGNPYQSLPSPIFAAFTEWLGVTNPDHYAGIRDVDCSLRAPSGSNVTWEFSAGEIAVPFERLITDLGNGTCFAPVADEGEFGHSSTGANGAPFLRSAYVTFDGDAREVTFSQVRYTDNEDIVPLH